jgi:fibronectin-binding autotransporter adhesin
MNTRSKKALASALGAATVAAGVAGTAFGQFSPTAGNGGNGAAGGDGGHGSSITITNTVNCGFNSNSLTTAVITKSGQRCGRQSVRNNARTKGGKGGNGGQGGRGGNAFNRF